MSTLFSRRPGKSGKFGFSSGSSSGKNKYGQGISNTDLLKSPDEPLARLSIGGGDGRPLSPLPLNSQHQGASPKVGGDQFRSLPSTYEHAADDFGRMTPTQTKPRGSVTTMPHSLKSPRLVNSSLSRINSPSAPRNGSDTVPASPIARALPPNVPQGEEAFPYGYTHEGWDIEVTQLVASQVVEICGKEIRARGLDSPLIFSSMALDLSASGVTSLIRSFAKCDHADLWQSAFVEEARYANVHNLAAMIKWTLARLGRFYAVPVPSQAPMKKGEVQEEVAIVQQRGWLELEPYVAWREQERVAGCPYTAFSHYCASIDAEAAQLLKSLFSLLSSTTSYSLNNGMTPSKLARLFGVLLFGLPEDETFSRTYDAYVRATNATEHLLLAHIRDLAAYEVLPIRLMNHVTGYPTMLSTDLSKLPMHLKTVPVTQVERQVRLYSSDLIQTACELDLLTQSKEWAACCSSSEHHGRDPQLSDRFRKLINLRGGGRQGRKAKTARDTLSPEPLSRGHSGRAANKSDDPASYSSVAQEEWGNFLFEGFTDADPSKLTFDLRETQRSARTKKRDTVGWNEFTHIGFDDRDDSLTAVLNFDGGLKEDIERWPGEKAELLAKLRESTVKLPPFPYDSTPKVVAHASEDEQVVTSLTGEAVLNRIDEVFAEVWADYLIGNGWANRDELTHRAANFVVVQYKSRSTPFTVGAQDAGSSRATSAVVPALTAAGAAIPADDRVDASWFVIQETVPGSYRADLEAAGKIKSKSRPSVRKLNVFRKLKRDKTIAGHSAPPPPPPKEEEDKLFPPGTKKLHLSRDPATLPDPSEDLDRSGTTATKKGAMSTLFSSPLLPSSEHEGAWGAPHTSDSGRGLMTALRSKTTRNRKGPSGSTGADEFGAAAGPVVPSKSGKAASGLLGPGAAQNGGFKSSMRDDSFGSSDFEVRSVHDPEDGIAADSQERLAKKRSLLRHGRNESKDDAWIDIMTRSKSRMQNQDAPAAKPTTVLNGNGAGSAIAAPRGVTGDPAAHAVGSSMLDLPEAESDEEAEKSDERSLTPVPTPTAGQSAKQDVNADQPSRSAASSNAAVQYDATSGTHLSPSRPGVTRERSPDRNGLLPTPQGSPLTRNGRKSPAPAAASPPRELGISPSNSREGGSYGTDVSQSVSASSSRHDGLDAFPAPPSQIPSPASVPQTDEEISFAGAPKVPMRSLLKPVGDKSNDATARDARVSAAVLRARELRAKLQPVDSRSGDDPVGPATPTNTSARGSNASGDGRDGRSAPSPVGRKAADPFAKNPTSGKVASIAARFGLPDQVPASPAKAGATSSPAPLSPPRSPLRANRGSPSPLRLPAEEQRADGEEVPASPNPLPEVSAATAERNALTKAALDTLPSGMLHPDVPPSPRRADSILGDNESLAPDDAASNYSRTTEDSSDPAIQGGGGANAGAASGRTNWDGKSQAQHDSQQAFQSALLKSSGAPWRSIHEADATAEAGDIEEHLREESQDEVNALPQRFAEPYQPGQPLDNVFEESESMLSGSNC